MVRYIMESLLLVEDSEDTQKIVRSIFARDYKVTVVDNLRDAESKLLSNDYTFILLDVDLPDGDGFKFCASLQKRFVNKDIMLFFLTGKSNIKDKILGFSLGAEDYIVKPFDPLELRVRVESRLKKYQLSKDKGNVLVKGNLKIDISTYQAYIVDSKNGEDIELRLTPTEYKLLAYFVRHEEHVVTRDQILEAVWGGQVYLTDRTVDVHISKLRKKIKDSSHFIQPIHNVGYKFSVKSGDNFFIDNDSCVSSQTQI